MKNLIFIISLTIALLVVPGINAQDSQAVSDKAAAALGRSDASALSNLLAPRVDMELPSSDGIYSRTQAGIILKDFFREYPSIGFSVKHSGSAGEGASYTIGTYQAAGKSFRVYFLMKKAEGSYFINQLRFEPEN